MRELVKKLHLLRCCNFPRVKDDNQYSTDAAPRSSTRKPGGWKAMPYIIGNETFERLATFGLLANFTVFLVRQLHVPQMWAANVANIWFGTTNFAPLIGAFLSDAYLGRFQVLAYSCIASFLGMMGLTLTSAIPQLQPPPCSNDLIEKGECKGPPKSMLGLLFLSLGFLTIGAGGIRPCSLPFGADQFNVATEQGRKGIASFFNWYYFTFSAAIMVAITVIVYIQDSVSWSIGLGIPTALMLCAIVLFFLGMRVYVYVPPEGSVFAGIMQVAVAAYMKRSLKLPSLGEEHGEKQLMFYNPKPKGSSIVTELPLTQQFRFLNKAAITLDGELEDSDRSPANPWRLCSVQKVEEFKCLLRIIPIWASGIICFIAMAQQGTFSVLQALKMNRQLGPRFQIPSGSLGVISMLATILFIPVYDRLIVPVLAPVTGHEGGITVLQRMGVGMGVSTASMLVAGLVEQKRRDRTVMSGVPISVMWLAPQLVLMGLSEAFTGIAQIEFYYKQFPENMRSVAGSVFFCSLAGASYLSSIIVAFVRRYSGGHGRPNWLVNDINAGRLDYYYYLLGGLGAFNCFYFVVCAHYYRYKGDGGGLDQGTPVAELEDP